MLKVLKTFFFISNMYFWKPTDYDEIRSNMKIERPYNDPKYNRPQMTSFKRPLYSRIPFNPPNQDSSLT